MRGGVLRGTRIRMPSRTCAREGGVLLRHLNGKGAVAPYW